MHTTSNYDIYLDDEREWNKSHINDNTIVCRSYEDFVLLITQKGLPNRISFDYHLGDRGQKNGKDAAIWLVNHCLNNNLKLPHVGVHSTHEIGSWEVKRILRDGSKLLEIERRKYYNIFLDDGREAFVGDSIHCRTFQEFVSTIEERGLPANISFDHDLGKPEDGRDCAEWLVHYCLKHKKILPKWNVHSGNPVGAAEIKAVLSSGDKVLNG